MTRSIAASSVGGRAYHNLRRGAWNAVKQGDLGKAQQLARQYEARLAEANRTIKAARATGAKLPKDLNTRATLMRQQLNQVLARIGQEYRKRQKQAEQAKKKQQNR